MEILANNQVLLNDSRNVGFISMWSKEAAKQIAITNQSNQINGAKYWIKALVRPQTMNPLRIYMDVERRNDWLRQKIKKENLTNSRKE